MSEKQVEDAMAELQRLQEKVSRVKEGAPVPGGVADVKATIQRLRETSHLFLEGGAAERYDKALDLVESYIDTKDKLGIFSVELEKQQRSIESLGTEQHNLADSVRMLQESVEQEILMRREQRARETKMFDELAEYLKMWKR